ncbi:MAG: NDP-sugar synthase [Candidatus Diapherotrites archaeon]|nr:NDP-sugar synthase [Candidatus Diapherotrites archaeon]
MKAIVLAGGYAKRFWPVTIYRPKPLLPVGGKPIMDFIMERLEEVPEIDTVYISTNSAFEDRFKEWLDERKFSKRVELIIEPTHKESEKFGTIKGVEYAIKKKRINSDLLVVAGDNIFSFDLKKFVHSFPDDPRLIVYDMKDPSRCSRYGVVALDDSMRVVDFKEKPNKPKSSLISTACYVFPKKTVHLFKDYLATGSSGDNMGFFLEWLYKRTTVRGFVTEGYWYDIGNKHYYIQANVDLMENAPDGSLIFGKTSHSRITRSYIGKNTLIKNSAIKECVIFDNVHIENCSLRGCIIDNNAIIVNVDLNDSLIAAYTKLEKRKIIASRRFFLPPVTGQEILKPNYD